MPTLDLTRPEANVPARPQPKEPLSDPAPDSPEPGPAPRGPGN